MKTNYYYLDIIKKQIYKGVVSMDEQKYKDFFENVRKFKQEQSKQKQRGLNDFNILTTVLKYHDEVRVHSRMIGAFLDINGKHYQDSLFLEKFLAEIKITNYDFKNSKLYLEYENIDLYLTDGLNHIIIENKIWAKDQDAQIKRYIDVIQKENDNVSIENLYVVYLSIDRKQPSDYSLDTLNIKGDYIVNKSKKIARFVNINYKNEILNWLEECQYEVQNITNLNEAIKQYTDVVKMITNQYEGKIMSLVEYIEKTPEEIDMIGEILEYKEEFLSTINQKLWEELKFEITNNFNVDCNYESTTKYEWINFNFNYQVLIEREENLYIVINKDWKYIKIDGITDRKNENTINMKNGNKNFWQLCKTDVRKKLIDDIITYIKENTK